MESPADRYHRGAAALHWLIATLLIAMLTMGWVLSYMPRGPALGWLYQWHKSIGLTVLLLMAARIVVRFMRPPPALPADMSQGMRRTARGVHWVLYLLAFALPMSGWVMVSSSGWKFPTYFYGLFAWPNLPVPVSKALTEAATQAHEILAILVGTFAGAHILAALNHHFRLRDGTLGRMWPQGKAGALAIATGLALLTAGLFSSYWKVQAAMAKRNSANAEAQAAQEQRTPPLEELSSAKDSRLWLAGPDDGEVRFAGSQADEAVEGSFEDFQVSLRFDPEALEEASLRADFVMHSALTGDAERDEHLASEAWFDVEQFPNAHFRSTRLSRIAEGKYLVTGQLTIRDITHDIEWAMDLATSGDGTKRITGEVPINRIDYEIGLGLWEDPGSIGHQVTVSFALNLREADAELDLDSPAGPAVDAPN